MVLDPYHSYDGLELGLSLWTYLSNKKGGRESEKVVLGDMVILLGVGIAAWKGDLSIIAGLR